jgi:ppGpp synthetase/RelA/SpoT-type nucleotidyltranferase
MEYIEKNIVNELSQRLNNAKMYYRIFSRTKSRESIKSKLKKKREKYIQNGEKMQDIIGIRIVFYFAADVNLFYNFLKSLSNFESEATTSAQLNSIQKHISDIDLSTVVFMPTRLNLVLRMNDEQTEFMRLALPSLCDAEDVALIDNTYEVQLRTVFSEGWHEVEHDLRYKTNNEAWWKNCETESRMLNGIFATLETSERAMAHIFDNIAYKNYKYEDWDAMIRNHFCIRFSIDKLPEDIRQVLSNNHCKIGKKIFKADRDEIVRRLLESPISCIMTTANIVYIVNRIYLHEDDVFKLEPSGIKMILDRMGFPQYNS